MSDGKEGGRVMTRVKDDNEERSYSATKFYNVVVVFDPCAYPSSF